VVATEPRQPRAPRCRAPDARNVDARNDLGQNPGGARTLYRAWASPARPTIVRDALAMFEALGTVTRWPEWGPAGVTQPPPRGNQRDGGGTEAGGAE